MSGSSQIALAREYWNNPDLFLSRHAAPWLVWSESAPSEEPIIARTTLNKSDVPLRPRTGEPVVLEAVKCTRSSFAFGVTVGRTENNDVVVRHEQVSRFHCFIQEKSGMWYVVDAGSRNGTFLDGRKLEQTKPEALGEHGSLALGGLKLDYFLAAPFTDYLSGRTKLRHG